MNNEQPAPLRNAHPAAWPLVIEDVEDSSDADIALIRRLLIQDMKERDQVGRARYGVPLQPFNGRDMLLDAYQEALDLCVYLRAAVEERPADITLPYLYRNALQLAASLRYRLA